MWFVGASLFQNLFSCKKPNRSQHHSPPSFLCWFLRICIRPQFWTFLFRFPLLLRRRQNLPRCSPPPFAREKTVLFCFICTPDGISVKRYLPLNSLSPFISPVSLNRSGVATVPEPALSFSCWSRALFNPFGFCRVSLCFVVSYTFSRKPLPAAHLTLFAFGGSPSSFSTLFFLPGTSEFSFPTTCFPSFFPLGVDLHCSISIGFRGFFHWPNDTPPFFVRFVLPSLLWIGCLLIAPPDTFTQILGFYRGELVLLFFPPTVCCPVWGSPTGG